MIETKDQQDVRRGTEYEPIDLSGRSFSVQELRDIKETVQLFPALSLKELALTICEHLSWVSPSGKYKIASCHKALELLQKRGGVQLPSKRKQRKGVPQEIRHSVRTKTQPECRGPLSEWTPIALEPVRAREERLLWNEFVERYHVLGYKRPFGAHQRYFIVSKSGADRRLGCLLFSASAWALGCRDTWIGWSERDRSKRLHLIVNNSRFLLFPWVRVKNLASHVLSLAVKRVPQDWEERYGYRPVLLETFVDPEQYEGTCYQAANWIGLGRTTGRGRMDRRHARHGFRPKLVYVYPLEKRFRLRLIKGEVRS